VEVGKHGTVASCSASRADPFGAGFALKILWWVAVVVLVVWLLGFVVRGTSSGGGRGRWYRW
jgi:hypothetical protein